MGRFYSQFLHSGIDLSPLGLELRADGAYFCTPRGTRIIGVAGVDGIHFCFVRGFGETVFAVSPMNSPADTIHPVAADFRDFLRLLLACGDTAALEQAWQWDEAQFDAFVCENAPDAARRAVLDALAGQFRLTPMERPWQYLHTLRRGFDLRLLPLSAELRELLNEQPPPAPREWRVSYGGSFWGAPPRERAGREVPLDVRFFWAGHEWRIPSVYVCAKGLVVDFCMRTEADDARAFARRWGLTPENETERDFTPEERERLAAENPLHLEFTPELTLNGRALRWKRGCGVTYHPDFAPEDDHAVMDAVRHYALDRSCCWSVHRAAFAWQTARPPALRTLALCMTQQPVRVPGPHFRAAADAAVPFTAPDGTAHTLRVLEIRPETLEKDSHPDVPLVFPLHLVTMAYRIEPPLPEGVLSVSDCAGSDAPRGGGGTDGGCASVAFGVIGGADGPTAVYLSAPHDGTAAACSALHFEPPADVEWRMTFHVRRAAAFRLSLIPPENTGKGS